MSPRPDIEETRLLSTSTIYSEPKSRYALSMIRVLAMAAIILLNAFIALSFAGFALAPFQFKQVTLLFTYSDLPADYS